MRMRHTLDHVEDSCVGIRGFITLETKLRRAICPAVGNGNVCSRDTIDILCSVVAAILIEQRLLRINEGRAVFCEVHLRRLRITVDEQEILCAFRCQFFQCVFLRDTGITHIVILIHRISEGFCQAVETVHVIIITVIGAGLQRAGARSAQHIEAGLQRARRKSRVGAVRILIPGVRDHGLIIDNFRIVANASIGACILIDWRLRKFYSGVQRILLAGSIDGIIHLHLAIVL